MHPLLLAAASAAISSLFKKKSSSSQVPEEGVSSGGSSLSPFAQAAASSYMNYKMNDIANNNAFNRNREMWDYTFANTNARQDFLNLNGAMIQKQALRNAGLSTASMDGAPFSETVGNGTLGSQSPTQFSFNPYEAMTTDANVRVANAQESLLKAQEKKTIEDTKGQQYTNKILESDSAFRDALNQSQLDMQYSTIQLNNWSTKEKEQNLPILKATAKNLNAQSESIAESIRGLRLQNDWIDKLNDAQLKKTLSEIGVNAQQVKNLVLTGASIRLGNAQISLQNDRLVFDLAQDKDLKELERKLGILGNVLKSARSIMGN